MIKFLKLYKTLILVIFFSLSACGDENGSSGPDLNDIANIDRGYFLKSYNQCSINNDRYDCNCVARVHVDHRNETFTKYKTDYDTIHKPRLMAEIDALARKFALASKNNDDERQLESMALSLEDLREKLSHGVNSITTYNIPPLAPSATDQCIIL